MGIHASGAPFYGEEGREDLEYQRGEGGEVSDASLREGPSGGLLPHGVRKFVMPPPMAGFIEFALMRTRGDIDQKYLSELYYQYMNVEEDFVKELFWATETKLGRVYVREPVLTNENTLHILTMREPRISLRRRVHRPGPVLLPP